MGTYSAPMPGGWTQSFTIKGDTPSDTELGRINGWIQQNFGAPEAAAAPKPAGEQGFFGSIWHGAKGAVHDAAMFPTTLRSMSGDVEATRALDADRKQRAEEDAKGPQAISWDDVKGPGDAWRYGKEAVGGAIGYMLPAVPIAAGAGAAAAGAVPAAAAGAVGAVAAGGIYALQGFMSGSKANIEGGLAQGVKPEDISGGKAAAVGAGVGILGAVPPLKILGPLARGAGMKVAEKLTEEAATKLAARGVTGSVARGVATEAGQMGAYMAGLEMAAAAGQRWQTNEDLLSPDALKEYKAAAAHGALVGGVLGGASGAVAGRGAPGRAKAELGRINNERTAAAEAKAQAEAQADAEAAAARDAKINQEWVDRGFPPTAAERRAWSERFAQEEIARKKVLDARAEGAAETVLDPDQSPAPSVDAVAERKAMAERAAAAQKAIEQEAFDATPEGRKARVDALVAEATAKAEAALGRKLTPSEQDKLARFIPNMPEGRRGVFVDAFIKGLQRVREEERAPTAAERRTKTDVAAEKPVEEPVVAPEVLPPEVPPVEPPAAPPVVGPAPPPTGRAMTAAERAARAEAARAERAAKAEAAKKPAEETVAPKADEIPPPPKGLSEQLQDHWAETSVEPAEVGSRMRDWLVKAAALDEGRQAALGEYLGDWAKARREIVIAEEELPHAPKDTVAVLQAGMERRQQAIRDAEANITSLLGESKPPPEGGGGGGKAPPRKAAVPVVGKAPTARQRGAAGRKPAASAETVTPAPAGKGKQPALTYTKAEDGLRWSNAEQPRLHWQDRKAAQNSNENLAKLIGRIQSTMPPDAARKALQEHLQTALVGNSRPHDIALLRDAIADRGTQRKKTPQEHREIKAERGKKARAAQAAEKAKNPPKPPTARQTVQKTLDRPTRSARDQAARTAQIDAAVTQVWNKLQRSGNKLPHIPTKEALRDIVNRFDTKYPNDDALAIANNHVNWRLSGEEFRTEYTHPPEGNWKPDPTVVGGAMRKAVGEKDAVMRKDDLFERDPESFQPPPDPWGLGAEGMNEHAAREVIIEHLTKDSDRPASRAELGKLVDWEAKSFGKKLSRSEREGLITEYQDRYGEDREFSLQGRHIRLDQAYTLRDLADTVNHLFTRQQRIVMDRLLPLVGDVETFVTQYKNVQNSYRDGQYLPKGLRPPVMLDDGYVHGMYSYSNAGDRHIIVADAKSPAAFTWALVHEALHPVFNRSLERPEFHAKVQALVDEVHAARDPSQPRPYGMKNIREFFTEALSNSEFQKHLDRIELSPEYRQKAGFSSWVSSVWDGLVDIMRDAIGMARRENIHTALDEMMRLAEEGVRMHEDGTLTGINSISGPPRNGLYAAMNPQGGYNVGVPGGPHGNASTNVMQGAHQGGGLVPGTRLQPLTAAAINEAALHVTNYDTVKMMRKMFGGITGVLSGDRTKGERFADWWGQKQIDRFLPLDRLVQELRATGTRIAIAVDPYGMMQSSTSRIARANDLFVANHVRPLADEVAAKGLTLEHILPNGEHGDRSVEGVAHLISAEERNAYFRAKDPTIVSGSGMTDAEITSRRQALINDPTFNYNDHLAAAQHYFKLAKYINDTREASGLITQGTHGMGPHWLPLRDNQARADATYEPMKSPFSGRLAISSRNDPRAMGRQGRSDDSILYNLVTMAKDANKHATHNEALQALHTLSQDPANHAFLESHGTDPSAIPEHHKIMTKINGVQHFIRVHDDRLAKMFNVAQQQGDAATDMLSGLQKYNNWARKTATVMSPEFIISNAVRDNLESAFKAAGLTGSGLKIGEAVRNSVSGFNEARKAMAALRLANEERRPFTPSNAWEQAAVEFSKQGGEAVSWGDTRKSTMRELDDLFNNQDKGTITKASRAIEKMLEVQGGAIENATRLSAFKALIDQGVAPDAAGGYARNVTVNFAQRGEWTPVLNTLYLFYNAGMQGTVGMFNAALRPGPGGDLVRKMLGGVVAMGAMNAVANEMLMGKDETTGLSKWAALPDYEKQSNIIMAMPWSEKGYAKIPLPHGLAALYNLGRVSADMGLNPPRTVKEAGGRISGAMGNLVEQVLPFGQTSSFANYITPTILRPVWQMYVGEDALGRKLSPDQASMRPGEKVAGSQNYWNSAAPTAVAISDFLHNISGGQGKHIEGAVEFPPGQITNLIQNVFGGAGAFLSRTVNYAGRQMGAFEPKADLEGEQWSDVPIVRRFVGDLEGSRITQTRFLESQERINSVGKEYDDLLKHPTTHTGDDIQRLMENHGDELIAYQAVKGIGKTYTKLGQSMHAIERSEMDSTTKRDTLNALKAQRTQLQKQMMRVYHDLEAL